MKSASDNPGINNFIRENSVLFWYIPEEKKQNISIESLVETILNYGEEIKNFLIDVATEKF